MRRRSRLRDLDGHARTKLARFERRIRLLRLGQDDLSRSLDPHQLETEVSGLVINLLSYWGNWCRAFYLSGALGATSMTGILLSSALNIRSEHDAMTVAIKGTLTPSTPPPPSWPSYQEPQWHLPHRLLQAISNARLNATPTLALYLNSAPRGLHHLRIMRNYYAHRSEQLNRDAIALGPTYLVGRARRPSDILLFVEPRRSISVLERWILDIRRLTAALCA
jgi:hypothetical protein